MLTPLSGKEKAARLPLDYFRKAGRGKWRITLGLVLGVLLIGGISWASGNWRQLAMPGKVHRIHATFEDNCSACHAPFQPTTSTNPLQAFFKTGPVSDSLCQSCHAGPPHHPTRLNEGEELRCSSCHSEHNGRNAPISQPADSKCLNCHQDLQNHVNNGSPHFAKEITRFPLHPQFNLGPDQARVPLKTAQDPGKLKFNHKVHLAAGMKHSETDARGWTLKDISDKDARERYRDKQPNEKRNDNDFVQLDCASCHNTEVGDAFPPGPGQFPPRRSTGDYMLPIHFDQHCKACHPLTFSNELPNVQIPHPLQPTEVNQFLWGALAEKEVKKPEMKPGDRPLPGENISRIEKKAKESILSGIAQLESVLYKRERDKAIEQVYLGKNTCGLCHYDERPLGSVIPTRIVPPDIPEVWFQHGKFNHLFHRGVACTECHDKVRESTNHLDVLLPNVENCKVCHGPAAKVNGHNQGGVLHNCTTCHNYHNGANPLAGLGAEARHAMKRKTLQGFLDGN